MLNGTMCATERTMCCIVENYQTPEGLRIPKVLQPYMGGVEFIPYKPKAVEAFFKEKEAKRVAEEAKNKKKGGNKKPAAPKEEKKVEEEKKD